MEVMNCPGDQLFGAGTTQDDRCRRSGSPSPGHAASHEQIEGMEIYKTYSKNKYNRDNTIITILEG